MGRVATSILALVFAVGLLAGGLIVGGSTRGYIGTLERMMVHYRGEFNYYFDGANKRGYIELCKLADGKIDVVYTDECAPDK